MIVDYNEEDAQGMIEFCDDLELAEENDQKFGTGGVEPEFSYY